MKAVVTGVAGFIGSHIAERLLSLGHEVIGIDDFSAGYLENVPEGVKIYCKDICAVSHELFIGVDVVFHNAASKKNICLKNPARDMEVNGIGTLNLLKACVDAGVPKFVHASTGSVYGEVDGIITEDTPRKPVSYYGISKTAGESYVAYYRKFLNTTILRYFHVYGSRQESRQDTGGVVAIFTDKILRKERIIIHGDGTQKRVFTNVKDIVDANIAAWLNPASSGMVYNCASPLQTDIIGLAQLLMKKYHSVTSIIHEEPLEGDIYAFDVDTRRIRELGIKFKPITEYL